MMGQAVAEVTLHSLRSLRVQASQAWPDLPIRVRPGFGGNGRSSMRRKRGTLGGFFRQLRIGMISARHGHAFELYLPCPIDLTLPRRMTFPQLGPCGRLQATNHEPRRPRAGVQQAGQVACIASASTSAGRSRTSPCSTRAAPMSVAQAADHAAGPLRGGDRGHRRAARARQRRHRRRRATWCTAPRSSPTR